MPFKPLLIFSILLSFSCNNPTGAAGGDEHNKVNTPRNASSKNPYHHIAEITLPKGYQRVKADSNSFAEWLRSISLKENKTVYLYNGSPKLNQQAQFAVMDISTGNKNLQQCADAVMRLRAEYLFAQQQYGNIVFTDNEQTQYRFTAPYSYTHFTSYLQQVFGMCGSASLSKQLKPVDTFSSIMPGDVLIRGGFPGHAAIVMDVAADNSGNKIFLLAQSYMPAQDIHVLVNPLNDTLSPWYSTNAETQKIHTPEYLFYKTELKQW